MPVYFPLKFVSNAASFCTFGPRPPESSHEEKYRP